MRGRTPDRAAAAARAAALRARQEALRARLRARRRPQRPRRRPWLLLLLLVALLAALCCCCARPEPVEPPPPPPAPVEGSGAAVAAPAPPPEPLGDRRPKRDRPDFAPPSTEPLPWLSAFRLQVSARSPRLARCFLGTARKGSLKWSAEVEPATGHVSDAAVETTLSSDPLSAEQRACVLQVLSDPPYHLEPGDRTTPARVSMAIEF